MSPAPPQRLLAGATILQIVPALHDDSVGRTAVDIARALLQSGARAMVAGEDGPLVDELAAIGGELLPMATDTFNPLRIHANARRLVNLIGSERIDIVHAKAWAPPGARSPPPAKCRCFWSRRFPTCCREITGRRRNGIARSRAATG